MRNRNGRFMPAVPNPTSGGANPALNVPTMTAAVVIPFGESTTVLSLHPTLDAARAAARKSVWRDARAVGI
jgi:hypothetical protein